FPTNGNTDDWNSWDRVSNVQAAVSSGELEVRVSRDMMGIDIDSVLVLFHTLSSNGEQDFSDFVLSETGGVLSVLQRSAILTGTISGLDQNLLNLSLTAHNSQVTLTSLEVEVSGSVLSSEVSSLKLVDSSNQVLAQTFYYGNPVTFEFDPVTIEEGTSTSLTVRSDLTGGDGKTIGVAIPSSSSFGVGEDAATATYISSTYDLGYVGQVPVDMTVDGGFADWIDCYGLDGIGEGSTLGDSNIDIMCYGNSAGQGSLFTYFDVSGRMLAGTDVPRHSPTIRQQVPSYGVDSDKDSVPDQYDAYPYDFNNDGISDLQTSNDYDNDAVTDYPFGSDYWLNTTIPLSYPSPYAGRVVSRYVGPIHKPQVVGEDVAWIFVDADNSSATGYYVNDLGSDYLLEIRGTNGKLRYAGLMEFVGSYPFEWNWDYLSVDVDVAFDSRRLEASLDVSSIQLQPDYLVTFMTSNWEGGSDITDGSAN
ncbi:MAG: hypothetical protein KAW09_00965, partial [Thermoplasmata archaeon]|nr:hypothetical protein [Thermoplasmata archaeon]